MVGFSKSCLVFWKYNVIINVWLIRRWSGFTMMLALPLIIIPNGFFLCSPQCSSPSPGPQHPWLLQLQHCGWVAGCHKDGPIQRQLCQCWLLYIWCGVPDDHGVSAEDPRCCGSDKREGKKQLWRGYLQCLLYSWNLNEHQTLPLAPL